MTRRRKPNGTASDAIALRRAAMEAVAYDPQPPCCANCRFVRRPKPEEGPNAGSFCKKGRFFIKLGGVCDRWQDTAGVRLEGVEA